MHPSLSKIRILRWVFLGRCMLAGLLLLQLLGRTLPPDGRRPLAVLTGVLLLFTLASAAAIRPGRRIPGRLFLYGQIIFDVLVLTIIVALTGGPRSMVAPLFILVISAGALLLPTLGGITIGLLASTFYFAVAVQGAGRGDPSTLLQALLFAAVALVIGYLGDRLRHAGLALGEVETELRRLQLDTGDILASIGTGVLTVDGRGRLAYLNPAAARLLSLDPQAWLDRPILAELDRIAPGLGRVITRTASGRLPIRRYQTEPLAEDSFVLGVSTTLVTHGAEGHDPAVTAIFQDITERIRLDDLRRRSERLEAVAELSASLAHEIKNPLASIRSAVEQMASARLDPEDAQLLGSLAVRESDRLNRLLGEFIDFARVEVTAPEPVDFTALVARVVEVIRAHPDTQQRGTTIVWHRPAWAIHLRGAEDLLHRAIFNLALNAVQWAGEGGRVEVELGEVRSDLLSPALGTFRLVHLEVRDSGPGIEEHDREQLFDPFFTRRPGGSGLGLAIVQRAIEAHGGAVFADRSPPGCSGATFALYLPALAAEPAAILTPDLESSRS